MLKIVPFVASSASANFISVPISDFILAYIFASVVCVFDVSFTFSIFQCSLILFCFVSLSLCIYSVFILLAFWFSDSFSGFFPASHYT